MYTPEDFKITDSNIIEEFITKNPFAMLASEHKGNIEVTHLPINRFKDGKLYGHVSISNIHVNIDSSKEVCFIFNGENAYISPTYYKSTFNVPTWNYSAVHIYGTVHYIKDTTKAWNLLEEVTEIYEGSEGWELPKKRSFQDLTQYIKFFEIKITKIEAKFKFSQNKSDEDKENIIKNLRSTGQIEVAKFMEEITEV